MIQGDAGYQAAVELVTVASLLEPVDKVRLKLKLFAEGVIQSDGGPILVEYIADNLGANVEHDFIVSLEREGVCAAFMLKERVGDLEEVPEAEVELVTRCQFIPRRVVDKPLFQSVAMTQLEFAPQVLFIVEFLVRPDLWPDQVDRAAAIFGQ